MPILADGTEGHFSVGSQFLGRKSQGTPVLAHSCKDDLAIRLQLRGGELQGEAVACHRRKDDVSLCCDLPGFCPQAPRMWAGGPRRCHRRGAAAPRAPPMGAAGPHGAAGGARAAAAAGGEAAAVALEEEPQLEDQLVPAGSEVLGPPPGAGKRPLDPLAQIPHEDAPESAIGARTLDNGPPPALGPRLARGAGAQGVGAHRAGGAEHDLQFVAPSLQANLEAASCRLNLQYRKCVVEAARQLARENVGDEGLPILPHGHHRAIPEALAQRGDASTGAGGSVERHELGLCTFGSNGDRGALHLELPLWSNTAAAAAAAAACRLQGRRRRQGDLLFLMRACRR
mmetsp:Transcript_18668/g.60795  ORF Transcript_18668/g.60795 Transcript_18668/m.60795 type:complete len:342 (+) Transcript_18668:1007-2032(+)